MEAGRRCVKRTVFGRREKQRRDGRNFFAAPGACSGKGPLFGLSTNQATVKRGSFWLAREESTVEQRPRVEIVSPSSPELHFPDILSSLLACEATSMHVTPSFHFKIWEKIFVTQGPKRELDSGDHLFCIALWPGWSLCNRSVHHARVAAYDALAYRMVNQ